MNLIGKIKDIGRTLDGKYTLTLESPQISTDEATRLLQEERLDVEIKKHRKKRSLDANSYYWILLSKLAESLNVSKPYMHNSILRKYGQIERIDGQAVYIVIPDTDSAQEDVDEAQLYHLKLTSQVKEGKGGVMYRTYIMLKGSSVYDVKEMSVLIDGIVNECKGVGIETIPPDELQRMMAAYKRN
jgi:hypothetical protein